MTSKPLTKILEISSEIRGICQFLVLFWYIVHVVLLTCSFRRLYSSKYFCSFPSYICILVCHAFIEPVTFSVGSNLDNIWTKFYGSAFSHFSYFLRFRFSAFNISLFRLCSAKETNKPSQTFLVLCNYTFKTYLFALQSLLSIVQ